MLKATLALTCFLCVGLVSPIRAGDDSLVRFDGGIGVIPVSNVAVNADGTVTVSRNTVRGVNPPGQIWVIARLKADVETSSSVAAPRKLRRRATASTAARSPRTDFLIVLIPAIVRAALYG